MLKSLLIGLAALLVLVTGATAAESKQSKNPLRPSNVNRLCVWVEQGGTPDTAWDLKAVKAYTATHKVCIVAKNGKNGKNGKAGAKGAQGNTGAQGAAGAQGAKGDAGLNGEPGAKGDQGLAGNDGQNGQNGTDGDDGEDGENGVSVTSAVEPAGDNCADGGSKFTAANDNVTYACNGAKGDKGDQGAPGEDGLNGSSIITVSAEGAPGEKTTSVDCPLTPDLNDDPLARLFAISGGFSAQGSVTESFRYANGHGWTVTQSSGNVDSLTVYAYCA